jgi:hypothetical protein
VLLVYRSNPGYLEMTEGSGGEPGRYDLGMLRRNQAGVRLVDGLGFEQLSSEAVRMVTAERLLIFELAL